ncbi:DUF4382 domain-containing protein [Geotalea toluenoxydans]|uniref:DUF4382 domain-containing protein n=1 Tax=Geotalea toluenoxydans TaxID=421624 RepID=UPI002436A14D|nr:DUF4382 domain-containing protein [Geotalea toluenoxydans]
MLKKVRSLWGLTLAVLLALAVSQLPGCGGGGSSTPTGTLKVGLTDAQSDAFANVFITIKEVRVVPAGLENAKDDDARLPVVATFTTPRKIDILTLRFVQEALGEVVLPAGKYNQIRLVLAPNEAEHRQLRRAENGSDHPSGYPQRAAVGAEDCRESRCQGGSHQRHRHRF